MPRRPGVEGTVKETPQTGSGSWIALLPPRLCGGGKRTAIPGRFATKTEARRALQAQISDIDRGRLAAPSGRRGSPVRRVRHVVDEYIELRENHPRAPLAVRTVVGYKAALKRQVNHPDANIGDFPVARLTTPGVENWLTQLATAGVPQSRIDYARRVLSASLQWEVSQGRLVTNPVSDIVTFSSKAGTAANQSADAVYLPTWSELASLIQSPTREEDRLLIALLAWSGLRWSEAVALDAASVWQDQPTITIRRVLVKSPAGWVEEAPKGGRTESIPLPRPLWERLATLARYRSRYGLLPAPAGRLLFRPERIATTRGGIHILDNTDWRRHVWIPTRKAANLDGDDSRAPLDPRRTPIKVKDLRAFTASVLVDAGASMTEAAVMLRHTNQRTTERHYARAMDERSQDPARMKLRVKPGLTLTERVEALWSAFAKGFPDAVESLGIEVDRARNRANSPRKRKPRK